MELLTPDPIYDQYDESSGTGVSAVNSGNGDAFHASKTTTSTASSTRNSIFATNSSGTAANNFGAYNLFSLESSTTNNTEAARFHWSWTDATHATRDSRITLQGVEDGIMQDLIYFEGDKRTRFNGRAQYRQGADVASAAGAITLGYDGNTFEITGTNAITLITSTGWQNGSEITLFFTSTASLTDGTANSGADIGMELNGNANFNASADDSITLVLSEIGGTQRWREKCRSVN